MMYRDGSNELLDGENLKFVIVGFEWCGYAVFTVNVYVCECVKSVIRRSGVEWLVPLEVRKQLEPLVNTPVTAPVRFNFGLRWSASRCSGLWLPLRSTWGERFVGIQRSKYFLNWSSDT